MSRVPWEDNFPDVVSSCAWDNREPKLVPTLKHHDYYSRAKSNRDIEAAISIVDDLITKESFDEIKDFSIGEERPPIIIAPSVQPGDSGNALAIAYAEWLKRELGWSVELGVFQDKSISRDKSGAWFRLGHGSHFYGEVDTESPYVIVDDVITLGGTAADLRSFIHLKGGRVIGISTIASKDGHNRQIRLGNDVLEHMEKHYGNDLKEFCDELFGYDQRCFTNDEARHVLGCSGYVDLRKKIIRARDRANAQQRRNLARKAS